MTTHGGGRLSDRDQVVQVVPDMPATSVMTVSLAGTTNVDEVLDDVTVGIVVHNAQGHVVAANEMARTMLAGLPTTVLDNAINSVGRTPGGPRSFTLTTPRPDGGARQLVATAVPNHAAQTVVTTLRDLSTERREAGPDPETLALRQALDLAERRLQVTVEQSPIGAGTLSTHGRLLDGNRVMARMLGRPREELAGLSLAEFTHPDDGVREAVLYEKLLTGKIKAYELEKRFIRPDGQRVWVRQTMAPVSSDDGSVVHLVLQAQDVTETRAAVERLTHQSRHDPLTGLANRVMCVETIQHALDRGRRSGRAAAVLCCDIDDFRVVNDGIGPGPGDAILIAVAARLRRLLGPADLAARLGGDEFVVVREQVADQGEAIALAERMLAAIREPIEVDGRVVMPAASVGIALADPTQSDGTALGLLRDAGTALHRAKSAGRGGWDLVDDALRRDARDRLDLESQLRTAVRQGQLRLHVQPIVDLRSGALVGREALVRWQHPERGLLPPALFLPVAEQTGLIEDLGRWVLDEAARIAEATPGQGYVAINVSPSQVRRTGLTEDVRAALAGRRLDPSRLVIELTESVMLSGAPSARDQLEQLDALGVRLVVDDFGTGFSALSHLRDLPVSGIKIDRSFTQGLGRDRHCERIVEALTGLAQGLDVDLVAEGVETEHQAGLLAGIGCRHAQGYLFGRPEPITV